jgi:hypothetical protein
MARQKVQTRFEERPLRIKFDDLFVKTWNYFDEMSRCTELFSSSEGDVLDGLPVNRSTSDEIKDATAALRESLGRLRWRPRHTYSSRWVQHPALVASLQRLRTL